MFHHDPGSRSPRPHIAFPFHTSRRLTRRQVLLSFLLLVVVLSGIIGGWSTGIFSSHAADPLPSPPAGMTFDQFVKEGRQDSTYRGPLLLPSPSQVSPPPGKGTQHFTDYAHLPPSAEPATMQPLTAPLSSAFLAGSPGAAPLDLKGSDGRLDVQLQPGSLDLSHATVPGGGTSVGPLSVHLTQIHGHYVSLTNVLGSYQLQLVDSLGHVLSGITLHTPVTISYHYQLSEMAALGIDPGHVLLTWPTLIAAALQAKTPTTGLTLPMRNDPLTHTLTAQSMVLAPTPFDSSSLPANQSLPALHLASVQGNSGQSSYSYPMPLPPGTGGFTPQLTLAYSSAAPNERHNRTSPAGDEGDGWALNLGSISAEVYPTTPNTTWYVLNNVANVGDRLIPTANNLFDTEHISYLRIQQINPGTDTTCFHVWDKAGTYYELGCTADSLQYWTDSNGTRYDYRWDVNKIVAPNEGPHSAYYKLILASYLQESVTTSGHTSIRDAALKQIIYGDGLGATSSVTDVAGTVDFLYHAPFDASSTSGDSARVVQWASAYGTNYNCTTTPPVSTTWRCDDPLDNGSSAPAPTVMSTMSLDRVESYVGSDASSQAYRYDFKYVNGTFKDTPFSICYDPHTLAQEYCAGEHLLMSVTPWVFQSTGGKQLRAVTFGYSGPLHNTYYDSLHTTTDNSQQYSGQTYWQYLNFYEDLNTGVGGRISYATAYNNTDGTPTVKDGSGNVTDDRYDALYCTTHANDPDLTLRCTGNYAHPDDQAWSEQVVTSLTALGTDSSASSLQAATTTYGYYRLAKTGTYSGSGPWCSPDQYQLNPDKDCVGDNWLPSNDGDWLDYWHAEYQGFAQVWTTSPAADLTVDYYYSTEGWNTPMSDYQNFLGSQVFRQEVYSGTSYTPTAMLTRTDTTYATLSNACRSTTVTYPACETVITRTTATDFEGSNSPSAPWVQHDYTYDDYSVQYGLPGGGYHNLLQDSISSANASSLLKQWSYSPNDQTTGGWTYYTVDNATHSEVDDSTGHLWQCQDITYDEGAGTNIPTPAAGLPTTVKTYSSSACTPTRGSPLTTSYQGYDAYGNTVASVDGVAAANSALYTSSGCTLATAPVIKSSAWSQSHYTACSVYDSYNAQPATVTNALGQAGSISYDYTQGALPTSATDPNNQTTSTSYSYDANGNRTIQVSLPLHSGSYTSQSGTASGCTNSSTLPCFELDSKTYLYNTVQSSTFYDSLGRAVETRTPGPGSGYDTLVISTYNDQAHSVWQSVPFEIAHGSGWVDPNGVTDYQNTAPGGTVTFFDALGRPLAAQDPLFGSSQEPGIACSATLSGSYTACSNYNLGSISGDTNTYATLTTVDPNKHVRVSYLDALGRTVYTQEDSGRYGGGPTVNQRQNLVYNVLNELTQVKVIDKAPLTNQTITTVTTTAQYDDLGRLTQVADPDRGTHTYTLDADGRVLTDVSGTRTIGSNYDLLGRVGCVQDATPTINATGACSAGNPYVQNTYDTSKLTVSGTTDYPIGRLTQSVAKTYLTGAPGGDSVTTTQSYEHDARGRLQAAQLQFGTLPNSWGVTTALPSYLVQYTLNDADQLYSTTTSTTPSGQGYTTSQLYDSTTGALTGLSNQALATSANLATLVYNARAQVDTSNFQTTNGTALASDQFGYDANLRPTSVTATWQSGSGTSGTMLSQSRSYDPASNVISLATTQAAVPGSSGSGGSESQNFCYDEQNRLVWAGNSGTQPGAGNGTCGTATLSNSLSGASYNNSYVYTHLDQLWQGPLNGSGSQQQYLYCNSQPHELTGLYASGATCANQTGQVYASSDDSWGNVTSRTYSGTTSTLTYDLLDHFVNWNAGTANKDLYVYDASGTRVLRRTTNSSGTTMTVYAFGLEEHSYFNTGGHKSDLYYYTLGGRLLGALDNTGKTTFYLSDALGSVLASFSSAAGIAAIKGNQVFGPYGNARDSQGTINTAKGFTGQYNDSLTGLDYYGSRYYDQVAGVFLSADVMQGNMQGMNPYGYVGGNPETKNDPTGKYFAPPGGTGNGGPPPSCVQLGDCSKINSGNGGSNPCTLDNCSVTLGGTSYSTNGPNGLKTSLKSRLAFLQAFYDIFASGYQVAELDFFNYLQFSGRLDKRGGYWDSVDYRVVADALLAAFDFLNHQAFQSATVRSWLAFMAHPTDNGWWVAHNGSINAGDHQARASGLYGKETPVEQTFINNAVHVINDIGVVSQGDYNPLGPLLGPRSPATGILNKLFDPQQYNDGSDIVALSLQGIAATDGGALAGGVIGEIVGLGVFLSTLFPT